MAVRILIVEDNIDLLEALADVLDFVGYDVTTSSSGVAAISRFAKEYFDLVICDHRLFDVEGNDVFQELRAQTNGHSTQFLVFTGAGMRVLSDYPGLSDEHFLSKSATMDELQARIVNILGEAEAGPN